ncbi:dTDP-4-dehydrorhamnose reductase family protein [Vibrio tetraodonis]|uniref:dTDP-4-dehydrorhamnose reductase family protein n=1 Tax=Vibrio tetraodonis TaxID=2231647 RepID=UPI000E0A46E7|nr:SDR family oxidoreductase [Vibrio tetraodonis]
MKILILGATGMLGFSLFSNLREYEHLTVFGSVRSLDGSRKFFKGHENNIIEGIDVGDISSIESIIANIKPDFVINCIGLIKQHEVSKNHISAIEINALLPHRIANICSDNNSRLIHFSTDCVFDGVVGGYKEQDKPTASDLYGKSKCLGEVEYSSHITLRTSIIGHELASSVSLIDWFLSQNSEVYGYANAVFSGLPTCYIAKILVDFIFNARDLKGLYHLSVEPIDKFRLLSLVAEIYNKDIKIHKNTDFVIDRSLDSASFQSITGFVPPSWSELVEYMHLDYKKRYI